MKGWRGNGRKRGYQTADVENLRPGGSGIALQSLISGIMKGKPGSDFFYMVFEVVRLVPYGRVTTYGAIANYLGVKGSSRMVGWAMNSSHSHHSPVPAHRVVNREGMLTGKHHFASPQMMQELLESEGIRVKNDKIQDFKKFFWDPAAELKL